MQIPAYIKLIMKELKKHNYDSWVVGGAVRDSLRGITPADYDIATNALPKQVQSIFSKTIPTGIKHGTVTVMIKNEPVEVTTLRIDGEYSDNRRPNDISFTADIEQDLARRDFTINAMAYNEDEGLVDPFNGQQDLQLGLIRCVGNATERFSEDALRLLRAVRFATVIEGSIENNTLEAIKEHSDSLVNVSRERIAIEMIKILTANTPSKGIRLLFETNLIKIVLPELVKAKGFNQQNPHHDKTILEHTLSVLDCIDNTVELRLAALLHDIAKIKTFTIDKKGIGHFYGHEKLSSELAEVILKRWCQPNKRIDHVCKIIKGHMRTYGSYKPTKIKKFMNEIGVEYLDDLFKLMVADKIGKKPPYDFTKIYRLKFMCESILANKEPLKIVDLAVNGNDMMQLGLSGKHIGTTLQRLLNKVLADPKSNQKDVLISTVKKWQQE